MSGRKLDMHRLQEVVRLHRLGRSCRGIARLLRMSRKTVLAYQAALVVRGLWDGDPADVPDMAVLQEAVVAVTSAPPPQQSSSVERWLPQIDELHRNGAGPTAIHDYLRLHEEEFDGTLSAVKRACARLRRERGVQPEDVVIPVETVPGDVAQVDFGYIGKLYDPDTGRRRKAWLFLLVLGHSRHMVGRIVFDQKSETWLRVHIECFRELGGAPRTIVPDNLKAAVVRAAFGADREPVLQRAYCELARHYGFQIDPTPPRAPNKKGKVERGVRYVRQNFLATAILEDVREARHELARWLTEVAGQRVHGTTRRRPAECFATDEKPHLLPLPARPFEMVTWKVAIVHRDSHLVFEGEIYSVPFRFVGKKLELRVTTTRVAIYHEHELVWNHDRVKAGHRRTVECHLPPYRVDLRHRSRDFWEARALRIGPATLELVQEVFDSDDVLLQLRAVQAIVTHLETFPPERAEAASRRALHFHSLSYRSVKKILREGLDLQPLPNDRQSLLRWPSRPRFSRVPASPSSDDHDPAARPDSQEAPPLRHPADPGASCTASGG